MLDLSLIRENPEMVRQALAKRQIDPSPVGQILELDDQRRTLIQQVETLKAERNAGTKEIGRLKDDALRQKKIEAMREVGEQISGLDEKLRQVETTLDGVMATIPNIPDKRTPLGKDEHDNVVIKTVGEVPTLGPGTGAGHHRFRAWREDDRLALLRFERGGSPFATRLDRLHARPARQAGLFGEVPAFYGQKPDPV
jgi:seryl-tRNA synthetase